MAGRKIIFEHTLEPGTGKAVEVLRGQIFRLEQASGAQCADFNAFNLHDYKEYFHCGKTRVMHGLRPAAGAMLWSAPPRERPMFTIMADTVGTNDVNFPRCTGALYESVWGFRLHTNCQDILAEAEREYGLTPDDVHDSFNFWMNTGVDQAGRLYVKRNVARKGDYVELMAHFDTLAVASVCGSDLFNTSNFELKSLNLQVLEATKADRELWLLPETRPFGNQQTVADFKIKEIKATRRLERDREYVPDWPVYPLVGRRAEVELSDSEYALLEALRTAGECGETDEEILRYAFFSWCVENRNPDPLAPYLPVKADGRS